MANVYDDIRNGTMIMPVGWTVWYWRNGIPRPLSERIKTVFADESGVVYYTENFWFTAQCMGETVFCTEREARNVRTQNGCRQAEKVCS